jgi:hypothetical protein
VTGRITPTQRAAALAALTTRFRTLPLAELRELWDQARATLDAGPRGEVLEALAVLAPAVDLFGGEAGVSESVAGVQLVARWQP